MAGTTDSLFLCSCGEVSAYDSTWRWADEHTAQGHRVNLDRLRAPCSPPQGCRRCGEPIGSRFTFYCGSECADAYQADHFWSTARLAAMYEGKGRVDGATYESWHEPKPCVQADVTCDGLIEVKCPNTTTQIKRALSDNYSSEYKAQIQFLLWISGREWCDFVSFDPRLDCDASYLQQRVFRDEKYIDEMATKVELFLVDMNAKIEKLTKVK